jgi:hypothetical protein
MTNVRVTIQLPSVVGLIAGTALIFAAILLLADAPTALSRFHGPLSSLPLALAGIAYVILQVRLKPARGALVRRLLLAGAFLFWAVDQLLPPGRLAIFVGDVVISAYVLDLCWMMQAQAEDEGDNRGSPLRTHATPATRLATTAEAPGCCSCSRYREPVQ